MPCPPLREFFSGQSLSIGKNNPQRLSIRQFFRGHKSHISLFYLHIIHNAQAWHGLCFFTRQSPKDREATPTQREIAMSANGFQNMLMITPGATAPGAGMGKAAPGTATGFEGEFAALLASLGIPLNHEGGAVDLKSRALLASLEARTGNQGFTGLGREFSHVLDSLTAAAEKNTGAGGQNLMALLGLNGAPGRKTQAVISALAQALAGETAGKTQGLSVDSQGLDALAGLLEAAGFDTEKVSEFIKDKKQNMDDSPSMSTPLQSLMASLGEFMKENDPKQTWDISTLPHLQTALEGFGIGREDIERILDTVSNKREGVDVDQLLVALAPYTDAAMNPVPSESRVNPRFAATGLSGQTMDIPSAMASGLDSGSADSTGILDFLDKAVKGEMTLDQFVSKLKSMTRGVETAAPGQKPLTENFAGAFAQGLHALDRSQTKEGNQAWTTVDMVEADGNALRFDTKKPLDSMFTENGDGLFKGHLKNAGPENTWASTQGTEPGKKQPAFDGVLKNVSTADGSKENPELDLENPVALVKAAVKGKNGLAHDSAESNPAVKSLAGTGFYGKAAEMTQVVTSEKNLPAYVTDQVARQISKAVRNGDSEIRFHIKPPDMGRVELSIATTASGLKISILTEHSATRDMLMNQSTDLRTILADQGIRIEKMDVGLSGNFGQNMAQARHDSDQSGKGRKQKDKPLFTLDPVAEKTRGDTMSSRVAAAGYTRGKLDLVA